MYTSALWTTHRPTTTGIHGAPRRRIKLMSSAAITEEPDGEQFKELLQELQARNPHENRGALEQGLRDKWRAGITEAQIVDAVEIDLLQPDC